MMSFFENKKGQGISLTVIIVATLALIVLVVLAAIFMGKMGSFGQDLSNEGQSDLAVLKISYGQCHPSNSAENNFVSAYLAAEESNDQDAKDDAYRTLSDKVDYCKSSASDKDNCITYSGCDW
tara:strand:- start:89 stop:457 length:369 start_codon:yes stop_codon:yes gene_type:complete